VPELVELGDSSVAGRELLARGYDQRFRLAQLLLQRLALRKLSAVTFQRECLALALFLLGRELPHQLRDDFAAVEPQCPQVIEDQGR
jgi:hypothetical protein